MQRRRYNPAPCAKAWKPQELEKLAARNAPIPDGLGVAETYLFLTLRALYGAYRMQLVGRAQAKKEKVAIYGQYERFCLDLRVCDHQAEILRAVQHSGIYENGCAQCRQLYDTLCGIRKAAEGGARAQKEARL
jgi:hypothetical protein